jgi:fatty-acid desaturase
MKTLPESLADHRVSATHHEQVLLGIVKWAPAKSIWFCGMALAAIIGGMYTFNWPAFVIFVLTTCFVLLFGHSLGTHRKLIHHSFRCPKWFEYFIVYCGTQVGLAGPLSSMRQHELRDFAQRLPDCHAYLRHGSGFWRDAWWQLNCELQLKNPPAIVIEPSVANDRYYRFLEATWMWQQLPVAIPLWVWGGWPFVFWGTCARVTAGVFGHWLIGYFAHNLGSMHHEVVGAAVQGHNVKMASLITMGESWHNNHHAFPGSARLGLYPGEWDPGWWVLQALRKLGVVWDIREPKDLPYRAEVIAVNTTTRPLTKPQQEPNLTKI